MLCALCQARTDRTHHSHIHMEPLTSLLHATYTLPRYVLLFQPYKLAKLFNISEQKHNV